MIATVVKNDILDELAKLNEGQQKEVLQFTRFLRATELKGVAGEKLLSYAGCIEPEDLKLMAQAIEEGCEQVNLDEW